MDTQTQLTPDGQLAFLTIAVGLAKITVSPGNINIDDGQSHEFDMPWNNGDLLTVNGVPVAYADLPGGVRVLDTQLYSVAGVPVAVAAPGVLQTEQRALYGVPRCWALKAIVVNPVGDLCAFVAADGTLPDAIPDGTVVHFPGASYILTGWRLSPGGDVPTYQGTLAGAPASVQGQTGVVVRF